MAAILLTEDEEVTLRRVAYGQSEVRAMRRADLGRLQRLGLIEDGKNGPHLTAEGKLRFDSLAKVSAYGTSGRYEELLTEIGRRLPARRR